jgi:hypothetical protein
MPASTISQSHAGASGVRPAHRLECSLRGPERSPAREGTAWAPFGLGLPYILTTTAGVHGGRQAPGTRGLLTTIWDPNLTMEWVALLDERRDSGHPARRCRPTKSHGRQALRQRNGETERRAS